MKRIAIIGATGRVGVIHAAACDRSAHIELAAICDINVSEGEKLADKYGCSFYSSIDTMLNELEFDIVDICVPTFLHKQFILLAAKHGKHVVCEKPVVLSLEDMDEILETVDKTKIIFMVEQTLRFWPEYVHIKKAYSNNEYGDIKMVSTTHLAQHPKLQWLIDPKKSGGGLFDLHIHNIDALMFMFGAVKSVYAVGWKSDTKCYDHVVSTLKFNNGVSAVAESSFSMPNNYPFTMAFRIVGEDKTAEYSMSSADYGADDIVNSRRDLLIFENDKSLVKVDIDIEIDAYQQALEYFTKCVEKNEPTQIITPEESRDVIRVILAIQKSIETGHIIDI